LLPFSHASKLWCLFWIHKESQHLIHSDPWRMDN
jgi:hypothetical protein